MIGDCRRSKKSVIYGDTDGRPVGVGLIPQLEHYPSLLDDARWQPGILRADW